MWRGHSCPRTNDRIARSARIRCTSGLVSWRTPARTEKRHRAIARRCTRHCRVDVQAPTHPTVVFLSPVRRSAKLARYTEFSERRLESAVLDCGCSRTHIAIEIQHQPFELPRLPRALAIYRSLLRPNAHCFRLGLLSLGAEQWKPGLGSPADDDCFRFSGFGHHRRAHQRAHRTATSALARSLEYGQCCSVVLGRTARARRLANLRGRSVVLGFGSAPRASSTAKIQSQLRLFGDIHLLCLGQTLRGCRPSNLLTWPRGQRPQSEASRRCCRRILDSTHVATPRTLYPGIHLLLTAGNYARTLSSTIAESVMSCC